MNMNSCCVVWSISDRHIIYIGIIMKIPAGTDLFKSVYLKRKTEKIQFDITVNYKKGLQEPAQSKVEYMRWHGCTVYSDPLNNLRAASTTQCQLIIGFVDCLKQNTVKQKHSSRNRVYICIYEWMHENCSWFNRELTNLLNQWVIKNFIAQETNWYVAALSHSVTH